MEPVESDRLRDENARLTRALSVAQAELNYFRRKEQLEKLRAEGVALDVAEELKDAEALDAGQWERHLEKVRTRYAKVTPTEPAGTVNLRE